MKIYLVRHGDAEAKNPDSPTLLSLVGTKEVESIGKFLAPRKIEVSYFFHSGKLRAQQTAELLAKEIGYTGIIEARSGLEPLDLVSPLVSEVNQLDEDAIYVGHMPFMGKLVSRLITGSENNDVIVFQTATIVCLEKVMGSSWAIKWVICPELLNERSL